MDNTWLSFSTLTSFATAWFVLGPLLAAAWQLFRSCFKRPAKAMLELVDTDVTIDITRRDWEDDVHTSNTYDEVNAYLAARCTRAARALRAENAVQGNKLVLTMRLGQEVSDEFAGVTVWWSSTEKREEGQRFLRRCYRLTFHRRHRDLVENEYLPHVVKSGREALFANRRRRLYSNNIISENSYWERVWDYVYLKHPTTFDKLAMDPAKKKEIMDDLDAFRKGEDHYMHMGKPWRRGYLLYGPPGTGKSSMIAAMVNYLNYDIYDVELTVVRHNHDLRKLLADITEKSIIVIEDIDCSLDLTGERRARTRRRSPSPGDADDRGSSNKKSKVTLSGLLNFIDGIWSACGGERIVVFTTNHVDKLDRALVRRGRMDMHIEMSYCCFEAFRTLAKNYLGVDEHPLFADVGELLKEVKVTPADVAECLLTRVGRGVDSALEHLIEEVKKAKSTEKDAEGEAAKSAGEKKGRRRRNSKKKKQEKVEFTPEADAKATAAAAPAPEKKQEMAEVTPEADAEATVTGAPALAAAA